MDAKAIEFLKKEDEVVCRIMDDLADYIEDDDSADHDDEDFLHAATAFHMELLEYIKLKS